MKKFLVLMMVIGLLASCGKSDEGGEATTDDGHDHAAEVAEQTPEPRQGIPDEGTSGYESAANAVLRPAFDKEGKETSKDVKPGEMFDLYVVAEFDEAFAMSGAEYKLVIPDGITVLGASYMDSVNVTLGKYETDVMMAFHCVSGPGEWLAKYLCKAEDDFKGGTVETLPGDNLNFRGFVMCDHMRTEIRAAGGTAEIGRK